MKRIPTLALTALLLATCAQPGSTNVLRLSDEPLIVSDVRTALRPTLEDTVGLHLIRDLELHGDTVIVADRNPRIVLLDRATGCWWDGSPEQWWSSRWWRSRGAAPQSLPS